MTGKSISKFRPILILFERRDWGSLTIIIFLTIICAFLEVLSVGTLFPLIEGFASSEKMTSTVILGLYTLPEGIRDDSLSLLVTVLCFSVFFAFLSRFFLLTVTCYFGASIGNKITQKLFSSIMKKSLEDFEYQNSSEFIASIISRIDIIVVNIVFSLLKLLTSSVIIFLTFLALLQITPIPTGFAFAFLVFSYFAIITFYKPKFQKFGEVVNLEQGRLVKFLNEGLGSYRELKLSNNVKYFDNLVGNSDKRARIAKARLQILSGLPKNFIESIFIIGIVLLAFFSVKSFSNFNTLAASLGVVAFGFQRMLPLAQEIYASILKLKSGQPALNSVLRNLLSQNIQSMGTQTHFQLKTFNEVEFQNIKFRHKKNNQFHLNIENLKITKGEKLLIYGTSGSGKSTFLDLFMGLKYPDKGKIKFNKTQILTKEHIPIEWWDKISLMPQKPFLSDGTVLENVCFGVERENIDLQRYELSKSIAKIENFVKSEETLIGENGNNLSGGQRQRIAIARSIYFNGDIIILDEATNALDHESEMRIIKQLIQHFPEKTMLFVSHSPAFISFCDGAIFVENGEVKKVDVKQAEENLGLKK